MSDPFEPLKVPPDEELAAINFEEAFEEEEFHFRDYAPEDYFTLLIFWSLIFVVFLQFFTRYVMGDSTTWTEEIARYLLILLGFVGSVMAVRKGSHIVVEFFYHYMPLNFARLLSYSVDLVNIGFYSALAWITYKLSGRTLGMMVSIDVPKRIVYYAVCAAFVLMALRELQRFIRKIAHDDAHHSLEKK